MNTNRRVVQVQEQTFRIGRQPQQRSFLDSCDPNGIPRYLRNLDYQISAQNRALDALFSKIIPSGLSERMQLAWFLLLGASPVLIILISDLIF
jgi:hypothetical protein